MPLKLIALIRVIRGSFRRFVVAMTWASLIFALGTTCIAADRPNFVWVLSEDSSKHYFQLFNENEEGARAPNIENLARHGLMFERAFSCSPVCSVARTTLITSVYAPRIGTQFHRQIRPVTLPEGWKLFPGYLKSEGYYTTNNAKEDYNTKKQQGIWDQSSKQAHWKNRPNKETPFFHMQTFTVSHESSLHFSQKEMEEPGLKTNPNTVKLAPYHPDTPLFRYTKARYHDRIMQVDSLVGTLVAELEQSGLLEDTFIFYFGDHGGVLPRSKGYLYEAGLHVPLVVRVPENFKHLVEVPLGERVKGFVSFVDFGPTLLHLAGVDVPRHMDGKPFLGPKITLEELNQRDTAFGYADRFDEKYELCRSLRKGRYKYLRNYQPYYPDALQNNYRYNMLAYQEWRKLFQQRKLNPVQRAFFLPKDPECLYDLETDPHETNNLAEDPKYQTVLKELRGELSERVKSLPDLSFLPESVLVEEAMPNPLAFGEEHKAQIVRLVDIADLSLADWKTAEPKLKKALASEDPWERYWAAIVCATFGTKAKGLSQDVLPLLNDEELLVRVRAAEFLAILREVDPQPTLTGVLKESHSPVTTLIALNSIVFLRDYGRYEFHIDPETIRAKDSLVERRLEYLLGKP